MFVTQTCFRDGFPFIALYLFSECLVKVAERPPSGKELMCYPVIAICQYLFNYFPVDF